MEERLQEVTSRLIDKLEIAIDELDSYVISTKTKEKKLEYDDEVVRLLAEEGYDANYGARPLRRTIQRSVEDALSEEIIAGKIALGDQVQLYVDENGRIAFRKAAMTLPHPETAALES